MLWPYLDMMFVPDRVGDVDCPEVEDMMSLCGE